MKYKSLLYISLLGSLFSSVGAEFQVTTISDEGHYGHIAAGDDTLFCTKRIEITKNGKTVGKSVLEKRSPITGKLFATDSLICGYNDFVSDMVYGDGSLWICTDWAFKRYMKGKVLNIHCKYTTGYPFAPQKGNIEADSKGNLFMTNGIYQNPGFYSRKAGGSNYFDIVSGSELLQPLRYTLLGVDKDDSFWLGSADGKCITVTDGTISKEFSLEEYSGNTLEGHNGAINNIICEDDYIWFSTDKGVRALFQKSLHMAAMEDKSFRSVKSDGTVIWLQEKEASDTLWYNDTPNPYFEQSSWESVVLPKKVTGTDLFIDNKGTVWIATTSGLYQISPNDESIITQKKTVQNSPNLQIEGGTIKAVENGVLTVFAMNGQLLQKKSMMRGESISLSNISKGTVIVRFNGSVMRQVFVE